MKGEPFPEDVKNRRDGGAGATLKAMMESSDDTIARGERKEDDVIIYQRVEQRQVVEKSEEILIIKEIKAKETEKLDEADEKIATFLHDRGLSEDLIRTLIHTGPTDEHVRLLKMLDLNGDDIDNLQDMWRAKTRACECGDSIDSTVSDGSADGHLMSPNSVYLKKALSKPLIQALREILMKKPADPVEYLGHWLLHFKICEERSMQRKQRDFELSIERDVVSERKGDQVERDFIEKKEAEKKGEFDEDSNYVHYGEF